MNWIDKTSFPRLLVIYVLTLMAVFALSVIVFFFPIWPLYSMLGWEFSNLGPIATAFWGILIDLFVVTPAFFVIVVVKLVRRGGARNDSQ